MRHDVLGDSTTTCLDLVALRPNRRGRGIEVLALRFLVGTVMLSADVWNTSSYLISVLA